MDPNETLSGLRAIVASADGCDEFADLFSALDGWITRGGFLPALWERKPAAKKTRKVIGRPMLDVDTSDMSEDEMRTYYKLTAPAADLRVMLSRDMPQDIRRQFEALDPWGNRASFYRDYARVQGLLRQHRNVEHRAWRVAQGQSQSIDGYWHDAEGRRIN